MQGEHCTNLIRCGPYVTSPHRTLVEQTGLSAAAVRVSPQPDGACPPAPRRRRPAQGVRRTPRPTWTVRGRNSSPTMPATPCSCIRPRCASWRVAWPGGWRSTGAWWRGAPTRRRPGYSASTPRGGSRRRVASAPRPIAAGGRRPRKSRGGGRSEPPASGWLAEAVIRLSGMAQTVGRWRLTPAASPPPTAAASTRRRRRWSACCCCPARPRGPAGRTHGRARTPGHSDAPRPARCPCA